VFRWREMRADARHQVTVAKRLDDVVGGAELERDGHCIWRLGRADHNNRRVLARGSEALEHAETNYVYNDNPGALSGEGSECRCLIVGHHGSDPGAAKGVDNKLDDVPISIRDKNVSAALGLAQRLGARGHIGQRCAMTIPRRHRPSLPSGALASHELLSSTHTAKDADCRGIGLDLRRGRDPHGVPGSWMAVLEQEPSRIGP
jgi:hypothetical protein